MLQSSCVCLLMFEQNILGDVLLKPIIEAAGKDITHWFDKKTKDVS